MNKSDPLFGIVSATIFVAVLTTIGVECGWLIWIPVVLAFVAAGALLAKIDV